MIKFNPKGKKGGKAKQPPSSELPEEARAFLVPWASIAAMQGGIAAASEATGIPLDVYERGLSGAQLGPRENANAYLSMMDYFESGEVDLDRLKQIDLLFVNLADSQITKLVELIEVEDGPALESMIESFQEDDGDISQKDSQFWAWFRETFYPKVSAAA